MNIYCFSGLGADERVFASLNVPGSTLHYVPWITPNKHETLADYASRLACTIDFQPPYALLGLSFGGMIAYELNAQLNPEKTILISSAKKGKEVNRFLWFTGRLGVQNILPPFLFRRPNSLVYHFFGLKTPSEKRLFRSIMENTSFDLLKWAMNAIVHWQPEYKAKVIRIHGTKDFIIPFPKGSVNMKIKGGTHFCILQEAEQISHFIQRQLT